MVRIFFLPYLGNRSKSDPYSYELFCLESHILSFPKVLQIPPESPCIYRVSQEECARLREGVPYVKVYRYNPKHLCPKLNGYRDNGQRKLWSSGGSTHCTCQLTALSMLRRWVWCHITAIQLTLAINSICTSFRVMTVSHVTSVLGIHVMYSAWNPKDNYDMSASIFVVQFNPLPALTYQTVLDLNAACRSKRTETYWLFSS